MPRRRRVDDVHDDGRITDLFERGSERGDDLRGELGHKSHRIGHEGRLVRDLDSPSQRIQRREDLVVYRELVVLIISVERFDFFIYECR